MRKMFQSILMLIAAFASGTACAQDTSLLPKYGSAQRSPAQQAADQQFINDTDKEYKGDLKKANYVIWTVKNGSFVVLPQ